MQRKQIMSINSFDNYPMSWKPDLSRTSGPKYLALVSLMEEDIKNGTLKAGTKCLRHSQLPCPSLMRGFGGLSF